MPAVLIQKTEMVHDTQLYFFSVFFPECLVGLYGMNCLENCSMTCGIPGNCDRITGYCYGGCQRGWTGVKCEEGKRLINNKP